MSAYAAVKHVLTVQQPVASFPVQAWYQYGFIPFDIDPKGACWTLDLSYDSWAAATMAKALGFEQDYNLFINASQNWRQVFNPEYKFFCPKTIAGVWQCPETWIDVFDSKYVEGDAWHYRFFVPGDVSGLVQLFGTQYFSQELEYFMYYSQWDPSNYLPNPYYWAGNEPDILSVYEFNYAGRPDLTQKYLRWLMNNEYTADPSGLPGNDDYGTMSAWYLFGALGFYPIAGSTTFTLGSPIFNNLNITRPSGNLAIFAYDASDANIYVQQASINGKSINITNPFIDWADLKNECLLQFWMGPNPPTLK